MPKINPNSKRQLKKKIKENKDTIDTLWFMVHRRNKLLRDNNIFITVHGHEF